MIRFNKWIMSSNKRDTLFNVNFRSEKDRCVCRGHREGVVSRPQFLGQRTSDKLG